MPKVRIDRVEKTLDGTGKVAWDIWAVDDEGLVIPGKHMTILTDAGETLAALNDAYPAQALRALLLQCAPSGWDNDALSERVAANLNSVTVTGLLDTFVQENLDGYPVEFNA